MTFAEFLPFICGVAVGLLAVALIMSILKKRGEVLEDELTQQIAGKSAVVGFLAMFFPTVFLWVKDIYSSRAAGQAVTAAVAASPFSWLLVAGLVAWLGATYYYSFRAGMYQGNGADPVFMALALVVLLIGFIVPGRWVAPAQFVAALTLLAVFLVRSMRRRKQQ